MQKNKTFDPAEATRVNAKRQELYSDFYQSRPFVSRCRLRMGPRTLPIDTIDNYSMKANVKTHFYKIDGGSMPAHKPEECDLLIEQALKNKDLDAAVALYEPNASLVLDSGEVVMGQAAIREALNGFLAFEEVHFTREITAIQSGDGNLAILRGAWSATNTGLDGKRVTVTGNNVEMVRRQPDGTWLFVIDNPRGAD
jgi:ketosteroid isomerase-like protein